MPLGENQREAIGEQTRDAIQHINSMGYFFGKVRFGKRAVPAPDNPRDRILVPDEEEQKVLTHIKSLFDRGIKPTHRGHPERAKDRSAAGEAMDHFARLQLEAADGLAGCQAA
jgi:hypothetical protein